MKQLCLTLASFKLVIGFLVTWKNAYAYVSLATNFLILVLISLTKCLVRLKWPSMSTRFTILHWSFFDLLQQKLSINFSDFFQFRYSSSRSHRLTLMCKHPRINVYRYSFLLMSSILEQASNNSSVHIKPSWL